MHVSLIFLIFFGLQNVLSQVTYQKGSSNAFYYVGNDLNLYNSDSPGRSLSVYYSFPVAFARTPKVYMVINLHDYWCAFPVGYYLDINSITTSGFIVTVTVPHGNRYYGIGFNWYAFDDLRRTVISAFNYNNPQSLYTFAHSNYNFVRAVVSLVSFVSSGYMSVRTQIDSITQTSVSVRVTAGSSLTYVGFQILIGTEKAMYVGPSIQYPSHGGSTTIDFPSGWTGTDYMISIEGMAWDAQINLRIFSSQTIINSQIVFTCGPWGTESYFDQLYVNYFFTLTQWNPGTFDSMLCIDYFLQKILDEEQALTTKLTLTTLAQTLVPTQTQTYSIDKSIQELNIEIIAKCYGTELWYMKVLKCDNQYQTYLVQCRTNQSFNSHRHLIKFRQNDQVNQKITVTVTSNYIQITQNIVDYYEQNPVILDLRY